MRVIDSAVWRVDVSGFRYLRVLPPSVLDGGPWLAVEETPQRIPIRMMGADSEVELRAALVDNLSPHWLTTNA